ncbi:MAG: hypothetical protein KDD14_20270, partial [Saprospiraceae bacterium]|nr:hypothetical protein [Saprospiraceae bacterium]
GFDGFLAFTAANEKGAESLFLFTIVEGRYVTLLFECTGTDCNGFREEMLPYARTIRFLPR